MRHLAWLAHGSGWSNNERKFGEMVRDAAATSRAGDDLTVWAGGGCPDPQESGDEDGGHAQVTDDRAHVLERLRDAFPTAWLIIEHCDDPAVFAVEVTFTFAEGRWQPNWSKTSRGVAAAMS